MSEEEILKNINIILEKSVDNRFFQTIKGILDLYNKEKKEINRLQEENNKLKEQIVYLTSTNNKDILKYWRKK